ncbi:hypothetical protein E0H73_21915 [Kribbella pittospori]|uniref:Adhesin domain-containing protein n=1 Tax=Kribbella pittospori TaxID=722689 RepID=A0A4V2MAU9_9ACTN|nr:hypothetical protein [Kribbella pittospori]TCC60582.1 hypothetical protein E0H73_21915 [Kribbella pittospori]
MSNQSDYDRRVKDVLDRVAKGHLSPEEATTLIAAIQAPTTSEADEPAPTPPVDSAKDAPSTEWPAAEDLPSTSVWADVVDAPDAADAAAPEGAVNGGEAAATPGGRHAAAGNGVQDSVVDEAPAESPVTSENSGSEELEEVEEVEEEHSNVPMPAGVQRVTVRAIGRRVRLIGEPAVNGVAVDGPHVIKRDGDTLAISSEGDMGVSIDGFSMLRNPTDLKSHVNGLAKELSIRVNPGLQVEVEVTGGSVHAERLPGLSRVRVTAGTAKVSDVDGPIDLLVQAGSANLDAQITKGRSRVRVESGTANVALRRGSDVRVHTEAQLGRVTWTGAVSGQSKDVEIGRGRAALDVEVLVGTAQIASD